MTPEQEAIVHLGEFCISLKNALVEELPALTVRNDEHLEKAREELSLAWSAILKFQKDRRKNVVSDSARSSR